MDVLLAEQQAEMTKVCKDRDDYAEAHLARTNELFAVVNCSGLEDGIKKAAKLVSALQRELAAAKDEIQAFKDRAYPTATEYNSLLDKLQTAQTKRDRAEAEIIELGKDKQTLMTGMGVLKEQLADAEAACASLVELIGDMVHHDEAVSNGCYATMEEHNAAVKSITDRIEGVHEHPGSRFLDLARLVEGLQPLNDDYVYLMSKWLEWGYTEEADALAKLLAWRQVNP